MANLCQSTFAFKSETNNRQQLQEFYKKINYLTSTENKKVKAGYKYNWLGNVADGFGFNTDEILCDGEMWIAPFDEDDDVLYVDIDTNWSPITEIWDKILEKFFPELSYVYVSVETGFGLFLNSDSEHKIFPDKYYVTVYDELSDFYEETTFPDSQSKFDYLSECYAKYPKCVVHDEEFVNPLEEGDE